MSSFQATTIVAVKKGNACAIAGDGQVTLGQNTIMKHKANKIRHLYNEQILAGFAGSAADAFSLFGRFEEKLEEHQGQMLRAAVELSKLWRHDKVLRKLDALMVVMDKEHLLVLSGAGDVIEPDHPVVAIGSGGTFAMAAAQALYLHSSLGAREIAEEALKIASSICVFTNDCISVLELTREEC